MGIKLQPPSKTEDLSNVDEGEHSSLLPSSTIAALFSTWMILADLKMMEMVVIRILVSPSNQLQNTRIFPRRFILMEVENRES